MFLNIVDVISPLSFVGKAVLVKSLVQAIVHGILHIIHAEPRQDSTSNQRYKDDEQDSEVLK